MNRRITKRLWLLLAGCLLLARLWGEKRKEA